MKVRSCQNCVYAVRPAGEPGTVLICTNKADCPGQLSLARSKGRCRNYRARRTISHRPKSLPPESDGVRFIPLTRSMFAIVDADHYDRLSKYKWCSQNGKGTFYAVRPENRRTICMHREIMNAPEGMVVDHIDRNGLNNRKSNLRICTQAQNTYNRRPNRNTSSKYKGVSFNKSCKRWEVAIECNHKREHLGRFHDETEAARVYDRRATEMFGEFAYLNFPESAAK